VHAILAIVIENFFIKPEFIWPYLKTAVDHPIQLFVVNSSSQSVVKAEFTYSIKRFGCKIL